MAEDASVRVPASRLLIALSPLLNSRHYRRLFAAQFISRLGDKFTQVALPFAVLGVTGSIADVGYVLAARTIPTVLFVIFGGVVADRMPSRGQLIAASNTVRFISQGIVAALLITQSARIWQLCALMVIYGTAAALNGPAMSGVTPDTVDESDLQRANALSSFTASSTMIFGPALAGGAVALFGAGYAIGVDSASFVLSALLLGSMRLSKRPLRKRRGFFTDLRAGWYEVRSRTWLWTGIIGFSIFQFAFWGCIYVLGPEVANTSLGGASAWGALLAVAGVGSLAGDWLAVWFRGTRLIVVSFTSLVSCLPVLLLLSAKVDVLFTGVGMFLFGYGVSFADTMWITAIQRHVPRESLSRVNSYDRLGSTLFTPVGQLAVGPIAGIIGVQRTLSLAALVVVCAIAMPIATRSVRELRTE